MKQLIRTYLVPVQKEHGFAHIQTLTLRLVVIVQVRAREQSLAEDEQRHQQLKEESKKQVSASSLCRVIALQLHQV